MLLLGALPHYFAHSTLLVGLITISADLIYIYCTPKYLIIRFPGIENGVSLLQFKYSTCLFLTMLAGKYFEFFFLIMKTLIVIIKNNFLLIFKPFFIK